MTEESRPSFEKPNFTRKYLEEDENNPNKGRDIITVSLNKEERDLINTFRHLWQCDADGTILKALARSGAKVLLGSFNEETLKWLASPKRIRRNLPQP